MKGTLIKADKDCFAVNQTIYSNADTNLNFDWQKRLDDTRWSDDCYWVMWESKRVGGIIVLDDCTRFPFLIEPFCDRALFWRIVIRYLTENKPGITKLYSVPDTDVPVLLSYGYKVEQSRRMMCRPAELLPLELDEQFTCHTPDKDKDLEEMTDVIIKGYAGGVDYSLVVDMDDESHRNEARNDLVYFLDGYATSDTLHYSVLIREKASNRVVALCMAGIHPKEANPHFSYISDITVLPEYRGKGLAKFMIQHAVTKAAATCDAVGLCVTVGNKAEALYREMGFWGGPRFTSMSKL